MKKDDLIIQDNAITFEVESLSPPDSLLEEKSIEEVLSVFAKKIEAFPKKDYALVNKGYHSFISGMHQAYAEHRPFVLSPDMIWLLICQGFSHHVNFSHGTKNEVFPNLEKQQLIVRDDRIILGNPESPWQETPEQFVEEIKDKVGASLIDLLKADFSTTTIHEKIAAEITVMHTFKEYFEYILAVCICGIPKITLKGTTSDWENIIAKLQGLEEYGIKWWTSKLYPILEEFVHASKGKINKSFWMNMFKVHTEESYGNPQHIDGWILNFYPYDRNGNIFNIGSIKSINIDKIFEELPNEINPVDFKYRVYGPNNEILLEEDMEYWAGFIGLRQDKSDYTLTPEISWFVSYKNKDIELDEKQLKYGAISFSRVTEIPEILFTRKEWNHVILNFVDKINIPAHKQFPDIEILEVNGKISKAKELLLKARFAMKDTRLVINDDWN